MRYRHVAYRYSMVVTTEEAFDLSGTWRRPRPGITARPGWRPDTDMYETAACITVTVDVAGLDDADLDVLLFEDALVVEGRRALACEGEGVYHAAEIRQGPFRVGIPLPAGIRPEGVEARYDRGLLHITLPKAAAP